MGIEILLVSANQQLQENLRRQLQDSDIKVDIVDTFADAMDLHQKPYFMYIIEDRIPRVKGGNPDTYWKLIAEHLVPKRKHRRGLILSDDEKIIREANKMGYNVRGLKTDYEWVVTDTKRQAVACYFKDFDGLTMQAASVISAISAAVKEIRLSSQHYQPH